ncbi:MAG: hypothetical protein ABL878_08665 [Burkholderiales bacterium]
MNSSGDRTRHSLVEAAPASPSLDSELLSPVLSHLIVGTLVHVPAGAKHRFRWRKGGGAMLSNTSRSGASEMFTDIHAEIAPDQPDVERPMAICPRHRLAV